MRQPCDKSKKCLETRIDARQATGSIPAATKIKWPPARWLFYFDRQRGNRTTGTRGEGRVSSSMLDAAGVDSRLQARRPGDSRRLHLEQIPRETAKLWIPVTSQLPNQKPVRTRIK